MIACSVLNAKGTSSKSPLKHQNWKDKYNKYYSHYPEADIARAMYECCKEKNSGGLARYLTGTQWEQFYECLKLKGFNKK